MTQGPGRQAADGLGALGLAERADVYAALYEAIEDGVVVFDARGKVLAINLAEARIFGYASPADMAGDIDHFARVFEILDAEGRSLPVATWPVSRVLAGETLAGVELGARRTDTGQAWVVRFSGAPVRDAAGEVVGAVVISADVTTRAQRERAVAASEARFRALADSMPQLVWTADEAGVVDYYNGRAVEYVGVHQRGDGTWSWQPLLHPDDLARTLAAWRQAVATRTPYACEHRARMADGSYRWHISRARLVPQPDGARWFGTATDIHEHKLVEERLERALAARSQVVSVVSHDLRNPLGVARMALAPLRDVVAAVEDPATRERGVTYLARLERQVGKMGKLLDELLDVARLQAGQPLELDRRPCDLVALVREVLDEQAPAAAHHALQLVATEPRLEGAWDPARLERAIANLVSNAIKYSAAGTEIRLEVAREAGAAVVRVIDHGLGIAPDDQARIFEWFTRGTNAPRATPGIGVGLAGARRIAAQHGGTLTVASTLGAGSTFTLRLPLP